MELWSAGMTLDVLSMTRGPLRNNGPFFRPDEDAPDTQVVIMDDRQDGPYFDLWTLFAKRKPVRLKDLLAAQAPAIKASIIVPRAGGSNLAAMRGLGFFRVQAASVAPAEEGRDGTGKEGAAAVRRRGSWLVAVE